MVGVPGRSKACATCRRRKKGCDFQRPSCSQCRRAGLECGGYERGRIFVHTTQEFRSSSTSFRDSTTTTTIPPAKQSSGAPASSAASTSPASFSPKTSVVAGQRHAAGRRVHPPKQPIADLRIVPVCFGSPPLSPLGSDRSLIGTAREDLLLSAFWETYLPNRAAIPEEALGYASGGWTRVVQSLYRKEKVLHSALMANCYSTIAQQQKSRDMAEESLRVHGRALHGLRLALNSPDRARSDGIFSALRLMIVFSMFFSDRFDEDRRARARGWRQHNQGLLALLRARGPEAHVSGYGHQMFVDCRLPLIIAAINVRRRSILNSHAWMVVPWKEIPKTPKDRIIDIMSGLPSILEGIDRLEEISSGKTREELRAKIINTCWLYDRQLCAWYDTNVPKDRVQQLENMAATDHTSTEDLSILYSVCVYCSAAIILYHSMHALHVPDLPERATISTYMSRIARHLNIFFQPNAGQYGVEMTSFPMGLCLKLLAEGLPPGDDAEKKEAMFHALLETERGKEILDFLRSMLETPTDAP